MKKDNLIRTAKALSGRTSKFLRSSSIQAVGVDILLILLSASLTGLVRKKEDLTSEQPTYRTANGFEVKKIEC